MPDNFTTVHRGLIVALAARHRVPAIYPFRYFATDGGLMSFSHGGGSVQMLQRVVRGVQQLQGTCVSNQVDGAEVDRSETLAAPV